ncbi:hypothetical protein BD408DRAFT_416557 [Parasitella parasitica]|nr:hypothetical protein BD408DRAFT_416557 [Parasitella parasitica]
MAFFVRNAMIRAVAMSNSKFMMGAKMSRLSKTILTSQLYMLPIYIIITYIENLHFMRKLLNAS